VNAPKKVEAESLAQAMAAAFAEIDAATKSNENAAFKNGGRVSKYADINAVIGAIKPALIAHNLFFTQNPRPNDNGVEVETILHHAGGECISLGSLFVPADKRNPQGFGSALTYARRYALVTAFGVPVEDDDGNAASAAPPRKQKADAPAPAVITLEQRTELMNLCDTLGFPVAKVLKIKRINDLRELPAASFDGARKWINDQVEQAKPKTLAEELEDEIAF